MDYHEAANYLDGLRHFRPKLGTETTAGLLSALGDPHEGIDFVQVAGSNGKGSTARMLESVLRETGLTVGLYTSPDLADFRERVRVDGRKVPESAVVEFVEAVRPAVDERSAAGDAPTFFEVLTVLALAHFGNRDVDVAVLEVGIGGRYDATSVVDPVAAAVTGVSLEHTDILGETVAEIAADKAHVAPADRPLVTGATGEALATIRDRTDAITVGTDDADVRVAEEGLVSRTETAVSLSGPDWAVETRLPLPGAHQAVNAGIAATLARQVAAPTEADLARGLRKAHWPGRFEVMGTDPLTVLDGAHNPAACESLAALLGRYDYDDLHLVVGAMGDKDHRGMAAALPDAETTLLCRPDVGRAADPGTLAAAFRAERDGEVRVVEGVADAVETALALAGPADAVVVAGSLYAVAEARDRWSAHPVPRRVRDGEEARDLLGAAHVPDGDARRVAGRTRHHVVTTELRHAVARRVKDEMLSAGGGCALSGIEAEAERIDVVLTGTAAQFRALVGALADRSPGLAAVARRVADRIDLDGAGDTTVEGGTGGGSATYPWEDGTAVMGILNVTPDSFHDGGEYDAVADAVARAEAMVEAGADVIDVGGESTRPGADPVPVAEEKERILPVVERLADLDALVSVDTRKAAVGRAAIEAGADVLNDVSGLDDPEMAGVAAEYGVPLVLMHSIDAPVVPGRTVVYDDVVADVMEELAETVLVAERAGVDRERIVVDPGLGFGKTSGESFELLDRIDEFHALGCPVLVGHSHKSMFGAVDCGPDERLAPTVAATALAADRGADVVRVHDVAENAAAVRAVEAARGGWDPE